MGLLMQAPQGVCGGPCGGRAISLCKTLRRPHGCFENLNGSSAVEGRKPIAKRSAPCAEAHGPAWGSRVTCLSLEPKVWLPQSMRAALKQLAQHGAAGRGLSLQANLQSAARQAHRA